VLLKNGIKIGNNKMKLTKSILKEIIREVIVEDWKISKSHGRGQSWTNYDQNNIRFQIIMLHGYLNYLVDQESIFLI